MGKSIQKKYTLKSFMPVISLVNKIAAVAEKGQHHPDITINYNVLGHLAFHAQRRRRHPKGF